MADMFSLKVNLVETPDSADITGILTVTDITEKTIQNKIIRMLSSLNYDLVSDVDLINDRYKVVSGDDANVQGTQGSHAARIKRLVYELVTEAESDYVKEYVETVEDAGKIKG